MVFRFLSKFWLNWKNSSGEDTLFLVCTKLFWNIGFSIRKKISDQHYGKISDQGFKLWSTKYLKLKIKNKSWYIHDFFEPVSYNASSTSPFNAIVIGYFDILIFWFLTFSLITVLAFHKDVSSIRIFKLHTCVLFIIYFSVLKPKSEPIDKIFIENQLAIKTNNSQIRNSLSNQMLAFKNWSVYFSCALGYIRFQQPHHNKKLWFNVTLLD